MDFLDEDFEQEEPRPRRAEPETPEQVLARKAERLDLARITRQVLEAKITTALDELLEKRLTEEVQAVFDEGWQATDRFGDRETYAGKKLTIRDRVAIALSEKDCHYRTSLIDRILNSEIKRHVETEIKNHVNEFQKELKEFKRTKMADRLRAALDGDFFR